MLFTPRETRKACAAGVQRRKMQINLLDSLLRTLFAGVRVHVSLLAPVVGFGAIRVRCVMRLDVGATFCRMTADIVAAARTVA